MCVCRFTPDLKELLDIWKNGLLVMHSGSEPGEEYQEFLVIVIFRS